jgi:mxaJ protein
MMVRVNRNIPLALLSLGLVLSAPDAHARELRVCADPNNLPFSNERGGGFENKIAELIADELGASLSYTWWAQRRGFIRNTLNADSCDLVTGTTNGIEMLRTTLPYYRSGYAFVTRQDGPQVSSLDDPILHNLRIGIQLVGMDGANPPPAEGARSARHRRQCPRLSRLWRLPPAKSCGCNHGCRRQG